MTRKSMIYILGIVLLGCAADQNPTLTVGRPPPSTLGGLVGIPGQHDGDTNLGESGTSPSVDPGIEPGAEVGGDTQVVEPDVQVGAEIEADIQVVEPDVQVGAEIEVDIQVADPDVADPEDVECYHNLECPKPPGQGYHDVCDQHVCHYPNKCASPDECPEGMCKKGFCFPHECDSNADCGGDYPRCTIQDNGEFGVHNICQPCKNIPDAPIANGCSEKTPFCVKFEIGTLPFCAECGHPGNCPAEAFYCVDGFCMECNQDAHCIAETPNCVDGTCVP